MSIPLDLPRKRLVSLIAVAVVSTLASTAEAEQEELEIGLGAKGGATFTGATEVPEETVYQGPKGDGDPELYGLFGAGAAGGPVVDIRYKRIVGLETGLYLTNDSTEGTNDIEGPGGDRRASITQQQSTTALHIPLLIKASVPSEHVRPVFGLGLEFVSQQSSGLEYSSKTEEQSAVDARNEHNSTTPSNYTLFQFTAGAEIDAGPVRIPIELRVGYNLGWEDTFSNRVEVDNDNDDDEQFVYDGEYIGHLGITAGVLYRWEIGL